LYRKLSDQNRFNRADTGAGQNSDGNRHAPTRRTGLAKMIVDSTTLNGMPVDSSVSMSVTDEVHLRVSLIRKTTGRIAKAGADIVIDDTCRRLDVGCLQGKLQHRRDHHDDDAPMKPRLVANPQHHTSKFPQ
jgi:hypothetical protein